MNILLRVFLLLALCSSVYSQNSKVYIADINGEIDLGLVPFIKRVINDAEKDNAKAIIFRINTFGGRVDAATQIKDAILSTNLLTVAYINNRAVSAGALISLSCKKIIMAPGSLIGAVSVVNESGEKLSEKYQSYMRSEMRSTAEKNGRRADIAEAMVDEEVVVKDLNDDERKLVSLTSDEAFEYKFSDTTLVNENEVLNYLNLRDAEVITGSANWAEDFISFLNNPLVSSLLIMIGFLGIMAEIKTPGWGFAGTAALIALALFFGSSYLLQLANIKEILMFVAGIILLVLEIFVIPGFGVAGILGIILLILSVFMSLISSIPVWDSNELSMALLQLSSSLVLAIISMMVLVKYLPKSKAFNKLILADGITSSVGINTTPELKELVGTKGKALTMLRPSGIGEFDGRKIDIISEGMFIEPGSKIKIIKVEGLNVVVKQINED